ncbi:EscV/YscV/HrcV family type III secretion system export apparatus protein, partial [Clostridium perfringens]
IVIGVMQKNMSLAQAGELYTRLTIGDGLVSQVPALLISTASGILVTRSGSSDNFGKTFTNQLTTFPVALGIVSAVMFFLALIPGMPMLPFLLASVASGVASYLLFKEEQRNEEAELAKVEEEFTEMERKEPENVMSLISVEPMEVEIGYGLIPLADESTGGDLLQRIASVRRQCAIEMGV